EEHLATASVQVTARIIDEPTADFEILILVDDSRRIRWLHPSREPKPLVHEIQLLAEEFGWQVSQSAKQAMSFERQRFFISLMDFFSILLPGALLTYLLMGEVGPVVLGCRDAKLAGAEAWAVFLFARKKGADP